MKNPTVRLREWLVWMAILAVTTAVLARYRTDIDQSHTALALLLVVLGGSVTGGRPLGLFLACASIALIDYFFQPPFDRFSVGKPLDGVALVAFLAVAAVTTELLARARQEAERARQRAGEVESLSMVGAATLRRAAPEEALADVATLVRDTVGAAGCTLFGMNAAGEPEAAASAELLPEEQQAATQAIARGHAIARRSGGEWFPFDSPDRDPDEPPRVQAALLALPLSADNRVIGVMVVRGAGEMSLDSAQQRFVFALAYYAALALERMRLVGEAAQTAALLEANRTKDKILASVSHDLRTPLTTIKVLAQGSEARGDPSASAIVEQADRLERMVADLLELSRLRAGHYQSGAELNTAEDVIGAALRRARGILGDRIIAPHIDTDSEVLAGNFDFVDTLRILGNLLDNAIRHSPPGGTVDLSVAREQRWLVFSVADRGPGVDPLERERIFEAFYRPRRVRPDTGHAGLGLSIARMLAELQGGRLDFSPRDGGGSVFTLRLPSAELPVESPVDFE